MNPGFDLRAASVVNSGPMLPPRLASRSRWRLGACALSLLASCAGEATSPLDAAPPEVTLDGPAPDADDVADGSVDAQPMDTSAAPDVIAPDVIAPDALPPDAPTLDVTPADGRRPGCRS